MAVPASAHAFNVPLTRGFVAWRSSLGTGSQSISTDELWTVNRNDRSEKRPTPVEKSEGDANVRIEDAERKPGRTNRPATIPNRERRNLERNSWLAKEATPLQE